MSSKPANLLRRRFVARLRLYNTALFSCGVVPNLFGLRPWGTEIRVAKAGYILLLIEMLHRAHTNSSQCREAAESTFSVRQVCSSGHAMARTLSLNGKRTWIYCLRFSSHPLTLKDFCWPLHELSNLPRMKRPMVYMCAVIADRSCCTVWFNTVQCTGVTEPPMLANHLSTTFLPWCNDMWLAN